MHRRFYDGDKAYLKNLVQCRPDDALPDHFVRLAILHWCDARKNQKGPAGVNGFHRVVDLVESLVRLGHDALRIREELGYLVKERCIVAEHLRYDIEDVDLIKITASGAVHLQLMANPDYLAACAEDTYLSDPDLAGRIRERITEHGPRGHFSRPTAARNASDLVDYLRREATGRPVAPEAFLSPEGTQSLHTLREAEAAIAAAEIEVSRRLFIGNIPTTASEEDVREACVTAGITVSSVVLPQGVDGENRGFAFIEVPDGRISMKALSAEGQLRVGDRPLRIDEAHSSQENSRLAGRGGRLAAFSERLYVSNLPHDADVAAIRALFTAHSLRPVDVYLATDRATGRSRGYAFVQLASLDEARRAIGALSGTTVGGRRLNVRPAEPRDRRNETE